MIAGPTLPLTAAIVLSAVGVWILARLAPRVGAIARVKADRWHTSGDIPRLAGPAFLVAVAPWYPVTQFIVLAAVCLIGAADDVRALTPGVKAVALLVAAVMGGLTTGLAWVTPAIWISCNAVNMLDHADGIAGATMAIAFAGAGGDPGLAAAGACIGFLIFNYPPAKAFMGDSGSLLLGAAIVLATCARGPLFSFGWTLIPLADACLVTARRLASGRKPWLGGTDHSGHELLKLGVPARLLPVLYAAAATIAGAAITGLA